MAGLGRIQQIFNRAVLGTLATLIGFARGGRQEAQQLAQKGHPLLAKFIKSNAPNANTPGTRYLGYCYGAAETSRRQRQIARGFLNTHNGLEG